MPHGIFQRIRGEKGKVEIPALGALIATMSEWSLTRRGGEDAVSALYDLRAVFSYLNPHLWGDEDYEKEIVVTLGRSKQFRVQKASGEETVLVGRTLLMKGVSIHEHEGR